VESVKYGNFATKSAFAESLGVSPSTVSKWKGELPGYAERHLELLSEIDELKSELASWHKFRDVVKGIVE